MLNRLLKTKQKINVETALILKTATQGKPVAEPVQFNHPIVVQCGEEVIGLVFYTKLDPESVETITYDWVATHLIGGEDRIFERLISLPDVSVPFSSSLFSVYSPFQPDREEHRDNIFISGLVPDVEQLVIDVMRIHKTREATIQGGDSLQPCYTMKVQPLSIRDTVDQTHNRSPWRALPVDMLSGVAYGICKIPLLNSESYLRLSSKLRDMNHEGTLLSCDRSHIFSGLCKVVIQPYYLTCPTVLGHHIRVR